MQRSERDMEDVSSSSIPSSILGYLPIDYQAVNRSVLKGFKRVLKIAEANSSEQPMQKFFECYPIILVSLISPHRVWVFPQKFLGKPLGGGWQPDFLMCDWTSNGAEWTIIELESPTAHVVNSRGISQKLRAAQQQISDYRTHMKDNWKDLQIAGLPSTQHQARSWIIIGRRTNYDPKDRNRVIDLRNDEIEVSSYDRLYEKLNAMVDFRISDRAATTKLISSMRK